MLNLGEGVDKAACAVAGVPDKVVACSESPVLNCQTPQRVSKGYLAPQMAVVGRNVPPGWRLLDEVESRQYDLDRKPQLGAETVPRNGSPSCRVGKDHCLI